MNSEYLTVPDVAELLQVNPQTVRRWIWKGKLPHVKVGGTVRVPRSGLDNMITFKPDRVKTSKSSQASRETSVTSIITQLEAVRNQIRTHSGEVENSIDVLDRLRESSADNE
jgi:excisionase family DNA binding protein